MLNLNHSEENFYVQPSPVWHFFQTPHTVGIDQDAFYAWSNNAAHGFPAGRAHSRYLKGMQTVSTEVMTNNFETTYQSQWK